MPSYFELIRIATDEGRYVVSTHADLRLRERRIEAWQIEAAMTEATLLCERPHDSPNPSVEAKILLPDGTAAKVIRSWFIRGQAAKLVSVRFFDR